jgi:N,N'-diacetyllegionaminate synthase
MKLNFIAELAQGYEGKLNLALDLIHGAKLADADYVKIQIVFADELSTKKFCAYDIFKSLRLSKLDWLKIANYSKKLKINLITEVFGSKSLNVAKYINSKYIKIHPTDINNFSLISKIKKLKPKIIFVGIGGAKKEEILDCLKLLQNFKVVFLHGHQTLPTPNEDLNISRIAKLTREFENIHQNFKFGIADHVVPNDIDQLPIISLAMGAGISYVEKHLTTNRVFKLEDHESALNPDEFKKLIIDCKRIFKIYGKNTFSLSKSEKKYRDLTRRVIVAKKNLKKNKILNASNLTAKRSPEPNGFFSFEKLFGKKTKINIKKDTVITKNHIV